ncbi:ABC transporter permease [Nocardioidaceae bacterium SCSIO 66511]|nr:ABC transporter permease [Nocardioidaceae bacterium SCSIO 66511]
MTDTTTSAPPRTRRAARTAAPAQRGWVEAAKSVGLGLALPVTIAIVWEIAGRQELIANGLFPSMTESVAALVDWIFGWEWPVDGFVPSEVYSGTWLVHVGASVGRILAGYVIGSLLAIGFGVLAGVSSTGRKMVDPMINAIRPISVTGWIPLAIIVLGVGDKPAIFLTALASFFPVYVNTYAGVGRVDTGLLRAGAMLGATRTQVVRKIVLPAASPSIVTGLRVASGIAWTTVVVAEILGAKSGVGYVLIDSYNQFQFAYVIAAMATLGICGYVTDRLVQWVFADALRWSDR